MRESGDAAARATGHTSTFVVTKITIQNRINVNHPRETFARAKTPRGQKSSNVGRLSGCFFVMSRACVTSVTLILKSITEFLLLSLLYNAFIFVCIFIYYTLHITNIRKSNLSFL